MPTASAMDSLVFEGAGFGVVVAVVAVVAAEAACVESVDDGLAVAAGSGAGMGPAEGEVVAGVEEESGAGVGSSAKAPPANPGPATSAAARAAVPKAWRTVRRRDWFRFILAPEADGALPREHHLGCAVPLSPGLATRDWNVDLNALTLAP